ncbi:MAG: hypothetical protein ACR2PS_18885 [Pseudomonadales bacterium]
MLIGDLSDTILNLTTFAFIGAMVWLLMRDLPRRDRNDKEPVDIDHG